MTHLIHILSQNVIIYEYERQYGSNAVVLLSYSEELLRRSSEYDDYVNLFYIDRIYI
jgi:hypothetical protein